MNRIKDLREAKGISMRQAASDLGMPYTTYVNYEKGAREPNSETLILLADYFCTSIDYMLGKQNAVSDFVPDLPANIFPMPKMKSVPLLGVIACGEPILAAENLQGDVAMPEHVTADFALRCKGDSMIEARIYDGDIVYIRQQPSVENGEIAAVLIGDEATLKRVYVHPDKLVLSPANHNYEPFIYVGEEISSIRILGKAVAFTSAVR